mgnify:CR=1 FL=1
MVFIVMEKNVVNVHMDIIVKMGKANNVQMEKELNKKVQVASRIASKHVLKERNHLVKNNVVNVNMVDILIKVEIV